MTNGCIGSIDKLVEQVEQRFDCKSGDHRAGHRVWGVNHEAGHAGYVDYWYTTVGLIALASTPDAQERLRQTMYESFLKLRQTCKSAHPVLYWRYGAAGRILEDSECAAHGPAVPVKYKIATRIAIPEADFSVVDGIVKVDDAPYAVMRE